MTDSPQLLTRRDAAQLLSLSVSKLEKMAAAGELVPIHIGAAVRYDAADVRAWIEEKKLASPGRTR